MAFFCYDGFMKHGFSLVELSIVLVILGLLTGGILAGQSLIRASELRTLTTDANRYAAAIYGFRDKYFGLPGDIANAQKIWGTWSTSGTPTSVAGARDGNGDGMYGVTAAQQYERAQFWRHLALAGLIEGNYAGSYAEPTMVWEPGVNVPRLRMANGRAGINTANALSGGSPIYNTWGSYLILQGPVSPSHILKPEEAWNIDTKMDDGNPSLGSVMGIAEGAAASRTCTTNDNWETASAGASTYRLDVTAISCWPAFWLR